jgi:membrane peptidoglycan carboxypeptidase
MFSNFFKPLNIICIICYIAFMVLTMDSQAVDALVFFINEKEGKPVYSSGSMATTPLAMDAAEKDRKPLVAIQYKKVKESTKLEDLHETANKGLKKAQTAVEKKTRQKKNNEHIEMKVLSAVATTLDTAKAAVKTKKLQADSKRPANVEKEAKGSSALDYIKAVSKKKWEYAELLDRYIVQYDEDTYIVLTIRPKLQKHLEAIFSKYSTRIGASIIKDPRTGEILAMTSSHKNKTLDIESEGFHKSHWALQATFPVASIFKIVTAAAGIDSGKITANSSFLAWRKSYLKVWKAFARSHNGVFGRIARKTTKKIMEKYIDAFGFNKTMFFDLPVGKSIAKLPTNRVKLGQAAAGLNRDFLVSPLHVASIVSTVLNRGKTMKPYLVDYVVRKNKIIFRRKPFQVAQPIKESTARDLYKMMYTTTAIGTGRKGFGGYRRCPDLSKMCGGKTGTLTGASPHYLFTWFGGFIKVTGRDLCLVTLVGQKNHSQTKAASIAGQIAYELYMDRKKAKEEKMAAN